MAKINHVVYYDGHCILCSKAIQFLLVRDKKKRLHFSPLQSAYATENLTSLPKPWPDSILLQTRNNIYVKSSAVLIAISKLGSIYKVAALLLIIPPFIRNYVYDWVAQNRYGWFGKSDTCFLPFEWKDRMI